MLIEEVAEIWDLEKCTYYIQPWYDDEKTEAIMIKNK